MSDYGRQIVVDLEFETAVGETSRLLQQEGLKTIARIDVRDHFRRDLSHDFRRYLLIEAWSSKCRHLPAGGVDVVPSIAVLARGGAQPLDLRRSSGLGRPDHDRVLCRLLRLAAAIRG